MSFTVFDNMEAFAGKPTIPGMIQIHQLGLGQTPPAGDSGYYYLDYEPDIETPADCPAVVATVAAQITAVRAVAPACTIGAYNLAPLANYWCWVDPIHSGDTVAKCQAINDALRPIAQGSDWLFPCLYTYYTDDPNWWIYAIGTIAEARRISGRPVAPFVWYKDMTSSNALVDPVLFGRQLQLIKQSCDGIVLWGGYKQQWDEKAAWWQATKQVLGI